MALKVTPPPADILNFVVTQLGISENSQLFDGLNKSLNNYELSDGEAGISCQDWQMVKESALFSKIFANSPDIKPSVLKMIDDFLPRQKGCDNLSEVLTGLNNLIDPKIEVLGIQYKPNEAVYKISIRVNNNTLEIQFPKKFNDDVIPLDIKKLIADFSKVYPKIAGKVKEIVVAKDPDNMNARARASGEKITVYPTSKSLAEYNRMYDYDLELVFYHEIGHLFLEGSLLNFYALMVVVTNEDIFLTGYSRSGPPNATNNIEIKKGNFFSPAEDSADFFRTYFYLRNGGSVDSLPDEARDFLISFEGNSGLDALSKIFPTRFNFMNALEQQLFGTQPQLTPASQTKVDISAGQKYMNKDDFIRAINYYRALYKFSPETIKPKLIEAYRGQANKHGGYKATECHEEILALDKSIENRQAAIVHYMGLVEIIDSYGSEGISESQNADRRNAQKKYLERILQLDPDHARAKAVLVNL